LGPQSSSTWRFRKPTTREKCEKSKDQGKEKEKEKEKKTRVAKRNVFSAVSIPTFVLLPPRNAHAPAPAAVALTCFVQTFPDPLDRPRTL
jgi:hypothetical protein